MKISIIGAGNMGGAIAEALLHKGTHQVTVSNRSEGKLQRFAQAGADVTTDNCRAAAQADLIVIAVKPWLVEQVLTDLTDSNNAASEYNITDIFQSGKSQRYEYCVYEGIIAVVEILMLPCSDS